MKKLLTCLALLLLLTFPAEAGTLKYCQTVLSVTDRSTTVTGSVIKLPIENVKALSATAIASNDSGSSPTLDIVVQNCRTTSTSSCSTIATFDQCMAGSCWTDGDQTIDFNRDSVNWRRWFRVVGTIGGTTPQYDIAVELCYE